MIRTCVVLDLQNGRSILPLSAALILQLSASDPPIKPLSTQLQFHLQQDVLFSTVNAAIFKNTTWYPGS